MVRDGLNLGDELDDLGGLVVGVSVVLVVLFPLEDEKNVDVNQLFSGHVCLLENMKPRVLIMHPLETRIASRQASALNNEKP